MSSPPSPSGSGTHPFLPENAVEDSQANPPTMEFSDNEDEDEDDNYRHEGDYSTRMEELMDDEDDSNGSDRDTDEGGFLYAGVDAEQGSGNYRDQLRDVLGPDLEEDDSEEEHEVENSLLHDADTQKSESFSIDAMGDVVILPESTPSNTSTQSSLQTPPTRMASPGTPSKPSKPFLHPTVSRLRSNTPQSSRMPSTVGNGGTPHLHAFDGISPSPSHFSAMSRTSSISNLQASHQNGHSRSEREVFRWTELQSIGSHIYAQVSQKASAVLGSPDLGSPMVLAANGLICVGTDTGKIVVFDFKQTIKCICGNEASGRAVGPVTALSLSHDHTYVASGHATGYIQLFDLSNPSIPARSVAPTSLQAIASGRKEGHIYGSRIVNVGFLAGRHTAIVSADDRGLAFYHSLGKVLFVEASDILRILGKYPEEDIPPSLRNGVTPSPGFRRRRLRSTILSMLPLPLGTASHPTDAYNIIALLTPSKLVIVGLKPTPRTWFKRPRESNDAGTPRSRIKGSMSWWPSIASEGKALETNGNKQVASTAPVLVYTWGNMFNLIQISESKIKQATKNSRTGKIAEKEVGIVLFEEAGRWITEETIFAVQWLNVNQIIALTSTHLEVHDVQKFTVVERIQFDPSSLVSPTLSSTINGSIPYVDSLGDVAHGVRVYKGKIFLLSRHSIQVGTLLTWADRILSFVQDGDFLSAINLTRSYYVGKAPGNRNGLPEDPKSCKDIVGQKLLELVDASTRYAFSEDRMTDGTHFTPDGRGVDRTSLFEDLVSVSARACIALNDFDFFFEDFFQHYDDAGISRIFLHQLEPFVLKGEIRVVPPRIARQLVSMHEDDGRSDLAERVIWHINPACLDINQAILLCQKHDLYDALIYVYTRALRDYVSPIVELLGLIRKVNIMRKSHLEVPDSYVVDDAILEPIILNAYKVYPYLANVLSGLTYPSEEPLDEDEGFQAKKEVYTFLFFGRSSIWPLGDGGKLVLTSDEEGGVEPTYPYARLLLRFDAESFLHSLDIAFEDAYLNNESQSIDRLVVVKILLEIISSSTDLSSADVTLVNIFIARNVPKYPQFLQFSPTALHSILVGLAEDLDRSTREDRQLAAEYLLSVYNPHESDRILGLFEQAGFYRILRSWYRHECQWPQLILAYLHDPEIHSSEIFKSIDDILTVSSRASQDTVPTELLATISDALPQLLQVSITNTALLLEDHAPDLHDEALDSMNAEDDVKRYAYLRYLLGPPHPDEDEYITLPRKSRPSTTVSQPLRHLYVSLQCQYHPTEVISALKYIPADLLDWSEVMQICESKEVYDAVVWATNLRGDPREALSKSETFERRLTTNLVKVISSKVAMEADVRWEVKVLEAVGRIGVSICLEHSQGHSVSEIPLEDVWFQLLSSQIHCVQNLSACCPSDASPDIDQDGNFELEQFALGTLRALVQTTFGALVSISSTRAVSFPRLFKRLVETTNQTPSLGTPYTEFRTILTGMLESYRSDGDMLFITKHLIDRDLFQTMEELSYERMKGWAPQNGKCFYCQRSLLHMQKLESVPPHSGTEDVVVTRTGAIYHAGCLPQNN